MRHLSARRFPDTITRRRQAPGSRNSFGEYVQGAVTETDFPASVQPIALEDVDAPEGQRLLRRLKVYVPEGNALAAAVDESEADRALVDGIEYTVETSQTWRGSHTEAVLLRET